MSSRSPSPPRRTVISTVVKGEDDSNSLHVEELIKLRNRKLMELYCVSRLNELLEIKSEENLKKDIDDFLLQNNLSKGHRFQLNTLPKLRQMEPFGEHQEVNNKKKEPAKRSPVPIPTETTSEMALQRQQQHVQQSLKPLQQTVNESKRRSEDDEADIANQRTEKKIKLQQDEPVKILDNLQHPSIPAPSISISPAPSLSQHDRPIYYVDLNVPPAEPTPIEVSEKFSNYLVREVTKKATESNDYFSEDNINSKESVYLLMKDTIPSKISQALPLAELKYMIQTLPLIKLIPMAHKALTTDIMNNALSEGRITVVSSRIEELRRLGLWSLRQPRKFIDAWENEQSHHRTLIEEAKWMQADFKEGQKYKIAICTTLAHAVMEYWAYGEVCCIKTKPIEESRMCTEDCDPKTEGNDNLNKLHSFEGEDHNSQTMTAEADALQKGNTDCDIEVDESADPNIQKDEGISTDLLLKRLDTSDEVALPNLQKSPPYKCKGIKSDNSWQPFKVKLSFDELNSTERTIAKDIPLYMGIRETWDSQEDLPFVPISKTMITLEDDHFFKLVERQIIDDEQSLVQLSKRRGMFYGNRRSHYLKPPPAPSLRYLQNRTPTIWLPEDDQELVKNINAYAYNWELISAHMTRRPSVSYLSNIERRTPWQCFERFVQLNERFNFNDLKGPRAHSVQQWLMEAHKFQQKQNRRISPLGVGPESIQRGHRRLRWASMFEAMRKCIKKRENAPRPNPTQPRKPLDCKNMTVPTPAEMSKLKAQRDEALRKDIQMRRSVKNRLQQQSSQMATNQAISRGTPREKITTDPRASSNGPPASMSQSKTSINKHASTPVPPVRKLTEREIIETYTRKILAQKPEIPLENAMKAAQNYYRQGQQRKLQLQQQQRKTLVQSNAQADGTSPSQPQSQAQSTSKSTPTPTSQTDQTKLEINNNALGTGTNNNVKSPTPQEILERYQKP